MTGALVAVDGVRARLLEAWPGASPPEVAVLVPNMAAYVRDASDRGLIGAAGARVKRARPAALARIGLTGLKSARSLRAMDFALLSTLLTELELATMRRLKPRRVILEAGLTDLALAAGNMRVFTAHVRHIRKRGAEAWLETVNPGHLLRRLRESEIEIDGVLMPLNPRGHGMKPDLPACLDEIARTRVRIWARDATAAGTVPFADGLSFAGSVGADAVVARPDELVDDGFFSGATGAPPGPP